MTDAVDTNTEIKPSWLVMLYIAADDVVGGDRDETLSRYAKELLERLDNVFNNPNIDLIVFVDGLSATPNDNFEYVVRYYGAKSGPKYSDCRKLFATYAGIPLNNPTIDSGGDSTIQAFITWSCKTFDPEDTAYRMLSLVGHGGGWGFGFKDPIQPGSKPNGQPGWRGMCLDLNTGHSLSTKELGTILNPDKNYIPGRKRSDNTMDPAIDVLFLDACLMGMVEVAHEVRRGAHYLVAAESQLWAFLNYASYLRPEFVNADTDARTLAIGLVHTYNTEYKGVRFHKPFALAAIDLTTMEDLKVVVNQLANAMLDWLEKNQQAAYTRICNAYRRAQKFDYNSDDVLDIAGEAFVDLYSFAEQLKDTYVDQAARDVMHQLGSSGTAEIWNADPISITTDQAKADPTVLHVRSFSIGLRSPAWDDPAKDDCSQPGDLVERKDWNLQKSYGLSIYMPLGQRDCRPMVLLKNSTLADNLKLSGRDWCHNPSKATRQELTSEELERIYKKLSKGKRLSSEEQAQWDEAWLTIEEKCTIDQLKEYYLDNVLAFLEQSNWRAFLIKMDEIRSAKEGTRDQPARRPHRFRQPQLLFEELKQLSV